MKYCQHNKAEPLCEICSFERESKAIIQELQNLQAVLIEFIARDPQQTVEIKKSVWQRTKEFFTGANNG